MAYLLCYNFLSLLIVLFIHTDISSPCSIDFSITASIKANVSWFDSCTLYPCCCHPWSESESVSHSVMSNSLWFHGLKPTRLLYPWNFPGKNIGMGSHSLLERIFQTQGLNPGLLHCRWILYHLSHMNPFQVPPMELFSPFSSVQSLSHVRLFATPWTAALQASYPSPTPGVYSNSCPLSQWCHPTISSSVIPFSSHSSMYNGHLS